ncbi:MAG: hypothetical protein DRJ42_10875 [Deltaproteobacteria bacterium]|nr:MAG: hypothetical protein DRJ42_10875 [Deltaproteobacteria bacterium]
MGTDSPKSQWRIALGASASLVLIAAASLVWIRSRPAFSEEELAGATRAIDDVRRGLTTVRCDRPSLAEGEAAPEDSLAALLDPSGEYGACFRAAGQEDVLDASRGIVRAPDGTSRHWIYDVPTPTVPFAPGIGDRVFISPQHPPYPTGEQPPAYLRVLSACDGLTDSVRALASTEGQCSPFGPGTPGWGNLHPELLHLARAISVLAHQAARNGDLEGALTAVLHGVSIVQDSRRGSTSLVVAMHSIASEMWLWSTFNALLTPAPGPTPTQRARLAGLIDRLLDASPHPHDVFAAEALAVGTTGPTVVASEDQSVIHMLAGEQARRAERWCARDQDPADCFSAMPRVTPTEPGPLLVAWRIVGGPPIEQRAVFDGLVEYNTEAFRHYQARLLSSPVAMRLMKVALALSAERQRGVCPTDANIEDHILDIPFATGPIEVTQLYGAQYEITAPPLTIEPSFERMVFVTVCPAANAVWMPFSDP